MAVQPHIAHRGAYLRGLGAGERDARAGRDYRPADGASGTVTEQQAYREGYQDGWVLAV